MRIQNNCKTYLYQKKIICFTQNLAKPRCDLLNFYDIQNADSITTSTIGRELRNGLTSDDRLLIDR